MKTFHEIIKASETYALTGEDNVVIAKGSAKAMQAMRKKKGDGFRVWNAPASKIGDTLR